MSQEVKAEIVSWIKTIVFAVLFAVMINSFIIVNAIVPTGSMENNIMAGDRIVANRLAYLFSEPDRFDIVVFKYPDDEEFLFVKRIIGMPGETIEIYDGKAYINGSEEPLDDSFIKDHPIGNFGPFEIPEDSYFVMGDHRNISQDSRHWHNTYLQRDKILGRVWFKYYKGFGLIR